MLKMNSIICLVFFGLVIQSCQSLTVDIRFIDEGARPADCGVNTFEECEALMQEFYEVRFQNNQYPTLNSFYNTGRPSGCLFVKQQSGSTFSWNSHSNSIDCGQQESNDITRICMCRGATPDDGVTQADVDAATAACSTCRVDGCTLDNCTAIKQKWNEQNGCASQTANCPA